MCRSKIFDRWGHLIVNRQTFFIYPLNHTHFHVDNGFNLYRVFIRCFLYTGTPQVTSSCQFLELVMKTYEGSSTCQEIKDLTGVNFIVSECQGNHFG